MPYKRGWVMRKVFLLIFIVQVITACNFQSEAKATPSSTHISEPMATSTLPLSSLTPTQTSTLTQEPPPIETSTPHPTSTPTYTPTRTPLPRPFELSVSLSAVPFALPFAVKNDIAFIVEESRFTILNIADLTSPQQLWQSESLGDSVQGIAIYVNYAYLKSDNELLVWSIENLQNPNIVTIVPIPSGIPYLDVEENLLYLVLISLEGSRITTIDLSIPETPIELGTAELNWTKVFFPFTISNNHLFLIDDDYVEIVDISDPVSPVPVTQLSAPTNINSEAEIVGNLLYIGTHTGTFIYDITDIGSPQQVRQYANFQINGINIDGNIAYLFTEICGFEETDDGEITGGCGRLLEIVDFSSPTDPEQIGLLRIGLENCQCFVESVTMQGRLIYFEAAGNLYVLDTTEFVP